MISWRVVNSVESEPARAHHLLTPLLACLHEDAQVVDELSNFVDMRSLAILPAIAMGAMAHGPASVQMKA